VTGPLVEAALTLATHEHADAAVTGNAVVDLLLRNVGPTAVLVLFLLGKLATGAERDRLHDKLERTEAQREALRDGYDERVIPLLTRCLDLLERLERERPHHGRGGPP
jgi:hypothetical protein